MTDLEQLGALVAEQERVWLANQSDPVRQRERFLGAFRTEPRRAARPRSRLYWVAVAAISFTAAALFALWSVRPPENTAQLAGVVSDAPETGELVAAGQRTRELRFSDGSRVALAQGGLARVVSQQVHSTEVEVLSGTARLNIVHRPGSSWTVRAGPYRVRVVGTRFDVTWQQTSKQFTLRVSEGAVRVSGGDLGVERTLHAGQSLSVPEVQRSGSEPHGTPVESTQWDAGSAKQEAAPTRAPAREPVSGVPPDVDPTPGQTWLERARAGDYATAYRLAQAAGLEHLTGTVPADQLLVLADVARYSGHHAQARAPLAALRRRFAGSKQAATAAFQLGRLSGSSQQGVEYFRAYLAEQPNGALAREASGRLVELLVHLGQRSAAQSEAASYLKRYPHGPHAAFARSLLDR